ncbi:DedA family protein [Mycolicibacterium komossense]|uniref:DedA family protein n=1 Tax=Mycolicibacterium komossense TaxID=1779 RepID=UPI003F49AD68
MTSAVAMPALLDPMFWLGQDGPFGAAVLIGVVVIIFIETGLLFPFLPGDTLLFTAGVIAAQAAPAVDIWTLTPCAAAAAFLGGQCAYLIGRRLGPALFKKSDARFFKQRYLTSSHEFFVKYGAKTLVIGQFIGVVRTFAPVVAGISGMPYRTLVIFSALGSAAWGVGLPLVGYFLGNIPFVEQHVELIVLAIACLSTIPVIISAARTLLSRGRLGDVSN